ncbi:MAG: phospholipase D-like domain-containing protein [Betaproteobacteria bacterium]|nr:phospholipase D-like domain-containing protein [Betaproteobacteria bacterium]
MADDLSKAPSPWFIGEAEYGCWNATFKMLNCGKAAFCELYRAIQEAKHSINYICWGFQPSMYFVRDGNAPSIGELLEEKALQGVKVRVLCWAFPDMPGVNAAGTQGEANTPGRQADAVMDCPKTHTKDQYEYDKWWYASFDCARRSNVSSTADSSPIVDRILSSEKPRPGHVAKRTDRELETIRENLEFRTRGFTMLEQRSIRTRSYTDEGISPEHRAAMVAAPSHHQKVVVIDAESPEGHIAFVMGHNTLDPYWDTPGHNYDYCSKEPNKGRNVATPRQDLSSRITGPIVGGLYSNFKKAWRKAGGKGLKNLSEAHFRNFPLYTSKLVACEGGIATRATVEATLGGITTGGAQAARTQIQNKPPRFDIRDSFEHAVKNASRFIYIENQYFRWPPMAEWIKEAAARVRARNAGDSLYLFVITNSGDEGMGSGTKKTYQMLDSLGRADAMPGVARQMRINDLKTQINQIDGEIEKLKGRNMPSASEFEIFRIGGASAKDSAKITELEAKKKPLSAQLLELQRDTEGKTILPKEIPGLKVHICTLTAPDTPKGVPWPEVYIHSKLMIIDDVFMTLGSANINTRSMETDSEMNIAHAQRSIIQKVRRELWGQHTNGRGAQDDVKQAFEEWGKIINENRNNERNSLPPVAPLRGFLRSDPKISDLD